MPRTQFLDQLCPRSLVFNQNEFRFMKAREFEHGTFETWEIEFAAKDIEQVPGRISTRVAWVSMTPRSSTEADSLRRSRTERPTSVSISAAGTRLIDPARSDCPCSRTDDR